MRSLTGGATDGALAGTRDADRARAEHRPCSRPDRQTCIALKIYKSGAMATSRDTKVFDLCDPYFGRVGADWERVFYPSFISALASRSDEFSNLRQRVRGRSTQAAKRHPQQHNSLQTLRTWARPSRTPETQRP